MDEQATSSLIQEAYGFVFIAVMKCRHFRGNCIVVLCGSLIAILLVSCSSPFAGDRSALTRISPKAGLYRDPQWASDGNRLLFQFRPTSRGDDYLVTMRADGTGWNQLSIPPEDISPSSSADWWKEGTVAYVRTVSVSTTDFSSELIIYEPATGERRVVKTDLPYVGDASWNTFDNRVALSIETSKDHYSLAVYRLNSDEMNVLFDPPSNTWVGDVEWGPGGKSIVYTVVTEPSSMEAEKRWSLERIDIDTLERETLLSSSTRTIDNPSWSHDGEWIAIRVTDDSVESSYMPTIQFVAPDVSRERRIDTSILPVEFDWSPNNKLAVTTLEQPARNSMFVLKDSTQLRR